MAQDLIVQGEVIAGDDIDTGILLDLPVSKTKPLGLSEQLALAQLAAPVCAQWSALRGRTYNGKHRWMVGFRNTDKPP